MYLLFYVSPILLFFRSAYYFSMVMMFFRNDLGSNEKGEKLNEKINHKP